MVFMKNFIRSKKAIFTIFVLICVIVSGMFIFYAESARSKLKNELLLHISVRKMPADVSVEEFARLSFDEANNLANNEISISEWEHIRLLTQAANIEYVFYRYERVPNLSQNNDGTDDGQLRLKSGDVFYLPREMPTIIGVNLMMGDIVGDMNGHLLEGRMPRNENEAVIISDVMRFHDSEDTRIYRYASVGDVVVIEKEGVAVELTIVGVLPAEYIQSLSRNIIFTAFNAAEKFGMFANNVSGSTMVNDNAVISPGYNGLVYLKEHTDIDAVTALLSDNGYLASFTYQSEFYARAKGLQDMQNAATVICYLFVFVLVMYAAVMVVLKIRNKNRLAQ
jgi:hypothetical protein